MKIRYPRESKEEILKLATEVATRFDAMLEDHDYSVEFLETENRLASYILNQEAAAASGARPIPEQPGQNNFDTTANVGT